MITYQLGENREMGTSVYRCYDEERDLTYVTKIIRYLDSPLSQTIFAKETAALKRLKACENIVQLYGEEVRPTGDGRKEGVIQMEYVPGKQLREAAESLPSNAVRYRLVHQLMSAIHYAHEEAVIHRDINPKNILITEDYTLKLIDFGISKICGVAVTSGTTYQYATPGYAAPEVTTHKESATTRSDIYSAGAVIFFLFTGMEPPPSERIQEAISDTGGIDVELKAILKKMCQPLPENRYETIDDCEADFFPLYQRYCASAENYCFAIEQETIDSMKMQHIVPKYYKLPEIINDTLPEKFYPCTVRVKGKSYYFDGKGLMMECVYQDNIFYVQGIKRLAAYQQERNKRYAFPVEGKFHFATTERIFTLRTGGNDNDALKVRLDEFAHDLTSRQNIDAEYERQYGGIWKQYVQAMIEDARGQARHIRYERRERQGDRLLFYLDENLIEEDFTQETLFVYEKENRKKHTVFPVEVGSFLEYQADEGILVLKYTKSAPELPVKGTICVDYRKDVQQYRRQDAALDNFMRSETSGSGDLKGVITGLVPPDHFWRMGNIPFFNSSLDQTQKNAVRKSLEASEIALIQGPPGTGKTNVLVEVLCQMFRQSKELAGNGSKILIVSQSHAAVDKLLEDLMPNIKDVTAIRIGSEDKIAPIINRQYGLRHCEQEWVDESVKKCSMKLEELLSSRHIDSGEFSEFAEAMEGLRIRDARHSETEQWESTVVGFEEATHMARDDPFLQRCLAMDEWRRDLAEDDSLGEYYIKNADIVAGTCSGFISNYFVRDMVFDCVIVDEAAKATLPELMVPMVRAKKVILVGDHKQLPPVLDEAAMRRTRLSIGTESLLAAGFGKLWEAIPDGCKETLSTQYRMHPTIGTLISELFYQNQVQNGVSAENRSIELPYLKGFAITWLTTTHSHGDRSEQPQRRANGKRSFTNPLEITALQKCLLRIDSEAEGFEYSIGVITPYAAQVHLIRKRLQSMDFQHIQVDVNTVDAFQGSQRDIIIYSTVRSNSEKSIGFLDKEARLNVALSRAKRALIIIGDAGFFNDAKIQRNILLPILKYIRSHQTDCRIIPAEGV